MTDLPTTPFPYAGTCREQLRYLVRYATMAPSTHNVQPWRFRVNERSVDVYLDPNRCLPTLDHDRREVTLSVGAAIYNLRLAMRCFLLEPEVEILPDASDPDWMARVTIAGSTSPSREDVTEMVELPRRHTERGPVRLAPIDPTHVTELCHAAKDEGAVLVNVDFGPPREVLASLIHEGDRRCFASAEYRHELRQWTAYGDRPDGVPANTAGPVERALGWALSFQPERNQRARRDAEAIMNAPAVLMLASQKDDVASRLAAGQALQRVLLRAAAHGLSAAYYGSLLVLPDLRETLRVRSGLGLYPQLIFRLGQGRHRAPAPRRSLQEVLLPDCDLETLPSAMA